MAQRKSSEYFDIKGTLMMYLSKWYLFLISVIICVGLAFVYSKMKKDVFAVRANIAITEENSSPMGMLGSLNEVFGSGARVDDEIFIITSHTVYRDVVKNLGLQFNYVVKKGFLESETAYPDRPLVLDVPPMFADTLSTSLFFKVKVDEKGRADVKMKALKETVLEVEDVPLPATLDSPYGKLVLRPTEYFEKGKDLKTYISVFSLDFATEILASQVVSEIASRKSSVVSMGIDTPVPVLGMAILNDIIKEYNNRGIRDKNIQAQTTANFIDGRLRLLASDLDVAESDIQNYKQKEGIVDLPTEVKYQSEKKGQVEAELIKAQTEAEVLRMIRDFITDPANSTSLVPMTSDNNGLNAGITTYNELMIKRLDIAGNARSNNAALRALDEQLAAMRGNINTSVEKAYETQRVRINELESVKRSTEGRLGNVPAQERAYRDMMRQQTIKQELYVYLLQRREETSMLLANATPKGTIIDEAYTLIEPLNMSRKMMLAIAFIIGLLLPLLFLWLKNFLNDKFDSISSLRKYTDVPILGEICEDRSGKNLVVLPGDTSSTSELFRLLRSNLQFVLNNRDEKVILVTSTNSGEGKSFVSVNLAASLAILGKKVLLVGLDIRKPRLASYLGINPPLGLTQYLASSDVTLDSIIVHSAEIKDLDIICAGPVPPNPGELLASHRLEEFFASARGIYDYIVIDSAPVGMVSDTFALNRFANATVYVCRANYTTTRDISFINEVYDTKRLNRLSLVVNGTTAKKGYGYGVDGRDKHSK